MPLNPSPRIPFIGIFGGIGYAAGSGFVILIAANEHKALLPFISIAAAVGIAFFLQAFITKIITGNESHVLFRHLILSILLCSGILGIMKQPVLAGLDLFIIGFGVFHFFGRIGCFFGGCCHGRLCSFGIKYGNVYAGTGFPTYFINRKIFPVQIAEAFAILLFTLAAFFIFKNQFRDGTAFLFYLTSYSVFRFAIEFARGDADRPFASGFSEAQWTAAALLLLISISGSAGLFPFAWWMPASAMLVLISAAIVFIFRKKFPEYALKNPVHTGELIAAVEKGIADNTRNDQLPVGRNTSQDIRMTFSNLYEEERRGYHLAFSVPDSYRRIERINQAFHIIHRIRFPSCDYKMIADRNNVVHFKIYTDTTGYERKQ